MAAPTHDFDWYGGPDRDDLKRSIPKGESMKAALGLLFALFAFVLIALSFWFEANG
jgi:hypothetical protein